MMVLVMVLVVMHVAGAGHGGKRPGVDFHGGCVSSWWMGRRMLD
jgi:hypothetical protein